WPRSGRAARSPPPRARRAEGARRGEEAAQAHRGSSARAPPHRGRPGHVGGALCPLHRARAAEALQPRAPGEAHATRAPGGAGCREGVVMTATVLRPEGLDDEQATRLENGLRRSARVVQMAGWCVDLTEVALALPEGERRAWVLGRLQVIRGLTEAV